MGVSVYMHPFMYVCMYVSIWCTFRGSLYKDIITFYCIVYMATFDQDCNIMLSNYVPHHHLRFNIPCVLSDSFTKGINKLVCSNMSTP